MYPSAFIDADGQPLDGANRYVIHFDKDSTPPVKAFWSITMYDANSFFVANPINRYAVSSWMPLKKNKDGSLDIYVQARVAGQGQGIELAARRLRIVQRDDAHVLADRDAAVDHGWFVEAAGSHEGTVRRVSVTPQ